MRGFDIASCPYLEAQLRIDIETQQLRQLSDLGHAMAFASRGVNSHMVTSIKLLYSLAFNVIHNGSRTEKTDERLDKVKLAQQATDSNA